MRIEAVLVHQAAIFGAGPFDLPEHLLRLSEELAAWFVQIHRYNVDWTSPAVVGHGSRLKIAVRAVDIVSKIGNGNFSKDDVRLEAFKDYPQFSGIGSPTFGVDSSDQRYTHQISVRPKLDVNGLGTWRRESRVNLPTTE
jgi:hypothetical protein